VKSEKEFYNSNVTQNKAFVKKKKKMKKVKKVKKTNPSASRKIRIGHSPRPFELNDPQIKSSGSR